MSLSGRLRALLRPSGTGRWIFTRSVLGWMRDPALSRQLSRPFRALAAFCAFQCKLGSRVHGGRTAWAAAARLHRCASGDRPLRLDARGRVIHLDPGDPRMLVVPNEVFGSTPVGEALAEHLRAGDTFLDVGANHGAYSVVAASIVGPAGAVFAFEPQPRLARLVEASLAAFFEGRREVYAVAAGATRSTVQLLAPAGSSGEAGLFEEFSGGGRHRAYSVPLERIDVLLADRELPGRVLVKLDVEGSEYAALQGAERLIEERQPTLVLEVNPRSMRAAGVTVETLRTWLVDHGYRWFRRLRGEAQRRSMRLFDAGVRGNVLVGATPAEVRA